MTNTPPCPVAPVKGHRSGSTEHKNCPYCGQRGGESTHDSELHQTPPLGTTEESTFDYLIEGLNPDTIEEADEAYKEFRKATKVVNKARIKTYWKDLTPEQKYEFGQNHKDACLDLAIAETRLSAARGSLSEEVAELMEDNPGIAEMRLSRPPVDPQFADPVSLDPIRLLGLREYTDYRSGLLKEAQSEYLPDVIGQNSHRLGKIIDQSPDAEVDTSLRPLALAYLDSITKSDVEFVGDRVGDENLNVFVDAVVRHPKTGSVQSAVIFEDAAQWEDPTPPYDVRAKALYAAEVVKSDVAVAAVVGGSPRYYLIARGDTIEGVPGGTRVSDHMETLADRRQQIRETEAKRRVDGGTSAFTRRRRINPDERRDREETVNNLSALLGMSDEEVTSKIDQKVSEGTDYDSAVRQLIGENFSRESMGSLAGVDGETAGIFADDRRSLRPQFSDWIETGVVHHDATGNEVDRYSRLHGVDDRIMSHNGTGAMDIHNITPDMVEGLPRLSHPEESAAVGEQLRRGNVLVAHNAYFEKNHLNHEIPGLRDEGRKWLDTYWLAKHFLPTTEGSSGLRLEDFCKDMGVPYEGAHRATQDAAMMMEALEKFFQRDRWWDTIPE